MSTSHYGHFFVIDILMASKRNKMKNIEVEGTSRRVAMEDILKLDQQQQFIDTECNIEKEKPQLQWRDIYRFFK